MYCHAGEQAWLYTPVVESRERGEDHSLFIEDTFLLTLFKTISANIALKRYRTVGRTSFPSPHGKINRVPAREPPLGLLIPPPGQSAVLPFYLIGEMTGWIHIPFTGPIRWISLSTLLTSGSRKIRS